MKKEMKIALVTGGSRGLGKNMALELAKKGLHIILTYNSNEEKAKEVIKEIEHIRQQAIAVQLNVTDFQSFEAFFDTVKKSIKYKFGVDKIDYLVNNAGIGINAPFSKITEEQLDTLYNVQFKGTYLLTQSALSILNDGGGIVNVSTGLTRFALNGFSAYASMKSAIETLTKYQAKELGERKIRSNVIAPGAIETDFGGGAVRDNEKLNSFIASNIVLGRVGLPDDIGSVVAFLCTKDAKWINAQRIEVSGGQMI
ncbi:SDR family NAD(P)-dependent oxidoreductase [Ulvibacter litoralis]|uniref:NAD(P)-dependent dehydrogenase, short-chain alcohol dehydrogenase family n=1 Tax=Ulvibacter litoralis TaxID=227084 RepID=A0A1G7ICB4_9FLAO|nr:SDR family oxidoreductase [Ulvibacter litoralis]GHC61835.1 short-chain dehydrogenase [Ulvibacter litoralis]SDF10218.1 NAD(P)-dependent dehydrogenase, short-chain alcohol dehydrogenase family [Ulvibacter litoralis]